MNPRIIAVLLELEQRLAEPLTVARLAETVNLSPSRFAHLFRKDVGTGPMRHLQVLRMERAATLLARTSLMVSDVMKCVGYTDPSHFRRDFRRHHGAGPREWRDLLRASLRTTSARGPSTARGEGARTATAFDIRREPDGSDN
jgi:AraC family transcriptional regulator of arabinose operon